MSNRQTDNSFFYDKVSLRLNHLPIKNKIKVLDMYGGDGKIWNKIKYLTKNKKIDLNVIRIDQKKKSGIYLKGDNMKFLKSLDLSEYDIIDLDAYGIPFKQLEIIFNFHKEKYLKSYIFVTFIQTMFGNLPKKFLYNLGYTKEMVNKIPTIFNNNGFQKFLNYLSLNGIKSITHRSYKRKHYIFFRLK